MANKETQQFGAGISISFDRLISAADEIDVDSLCRDNKFADDVAVCCVLGAPRREKELADVLRELWSLDLRVTTLDFNTSDELLEYCRENGINNVVVLKSGEKGNLRIYTWERDRFQERKINIQVIVLNHFLWKT